MKKSISIFIAIFFVHVGATAETIFGALAEQLYNMIEAQACTTEFADENVKKVGNSIECIERLIDVNSGTYEYLCNVPDRSDDGRVYLEGSDAETLFSALGKLKCVDRVKTDRMGAYYMRARGAVGCFMGAELGKPVSYGCIIEP